MKRENELHLTFQHILNTATTLDEAKSFYYNVIVKIYPIDLELELAAADNQREFNWSRDKVIAEGEKVGA